MKSRKFLVFLWIFIFSISAFTFTFPTTTSSTNEIKPVTSILEAKNIVEKQLKSTGQVFEEINASAILSQLKATGKSVLPLLDQNFTLNLREKFYNLGSKEEIYFYNGIVENYVNSEAYLTIDKYRISGRIDIPTRDSGIQSYSISHISDYINPQINEMSPIHIVRYLNEINNTGYDPMLDEFFELDPDDSENLYSNSDCNCSSSYNKEQNGKLTQHLTYKISSIETSSYYAKVKIFADYYYYQHYGDTDWYFMDEINYVISKWDNTGQQNPDIQISVKSTDVWTSTNEGGSCYSSSGMIDLHNDFTNWGTSQSLFGTWYCSYYYCGWTGDTDFALLMTGKNWPDSLGKANYGGVGVYSSDNEKYAVCEIWPGLFTEIVSWGISHEWGHLFTGGHEAGPTGGQSGHRAWSWCDLGYFFGICLGYRQTNIWSSYIIGQSSIGVFSKEGVDGAGSSNNNIYYIRQWRNTYLRS